MNYRRHYNTRRQLGEAQNWRCAYCAAVMMWGRKMPSNQGPLDVTIDHVIPKKRGGNGDWGNIIAACHLCNTHRREMTAVTFWLVATGRWAPDGRRSFSGLRSYIAARERRGDPISWKRKAQPLVPQPGSLDPISVEEQPMKSKHFTAAIGRSGL